MGQAIEENVSSGMVEKQDKHFEKTEAVFFHRQFIKISMKQRADRIGAADKLKRIVFT